MVSTEFIDATFFLNTRYIEKMNTKGNKDNKILQKKRSKEKIKIRIQRHQCGEAAKSVTETKMCTKPYRN
jgi:hypothetical protein